MRKQVNLESERVDAMNPEYVARYFTRIKALMRKFDIDEPTRIFNLDESGFYIKGMTFGRWKCILKKKSR